MSPLPDLETGSSGSELKENHGSVDRNIDLSEYPALIRYISTYRDGSAKASVVAIDEITSAKWHWYTPWRSRQQGEKPGKGVDFEVQHNWLNTDVKRGLTSGEVENRCKKVGWNELTSEKENLFIKFLMYFTGPISMVCFPRRVAWSCVLT